MKGFSVKSKDLNLQNPLPKIPEAPKAPPVLKASQIPKVPAKPPQVPKPNINGPKIIRDAWNALQKAHDEDRIPHPDLGIKLHWERNKNVVDDGLHYAGFGFKSPADKESEQPKPASPVQNTNDIKGDRKEIVQNNSAKQIEKPKGSAVLKIQESVQQHSAPISADVPQRPATLNVEDAKQTRPEVSTATQSPSNPERELTVQPELSINLKEDFADAAPRRDQNDVQGYEINPMDDSLNTSEDQVNNNDPTESVSEPKSKSREEPTGKAETSIMSDEQIKLVSATVLSGAGLFISAMAAKEAHQQYVEKRNERNAAKQEQLRLNELGAAVTQAELMREDILKNVPLNLEKIYALRGFVQQIRPQLNPENGSDRMLAMRLVTIEQYIYAVTKAGNSSPRSRKLEI